MLCAIFLQLQYLCAVKFLPVNCVGIGVGYPLRLLHVDGPLDGSLSKSGMQRDEYPYASTFEGVAGANVALVPLGENSKQGRT